MIHEFGFDVLDRLHEMDSGLHRSLVEKLIEDGQGEVLCGYKGLPVDLLPKCVDGSPGAARVAARREDCPVDLLMQFGVDTDEAVRVAAYHSPTATPEVQAAVILSTSQDRIVEGQPLSTPLSVQCDIFDKLYMDYSDDERIAEFFEDWDVGAPLGYLVAHGACRPTEVGIECIEAAWKALCELLVVPPTGEYASLEEMIDAAEEW